MSGAAREELGKERVALWRLTLRFRYATISEQTSEQRINSVNSTGMKAGTFVPRQVVRKTGHRKAIQST
jgi:hypothetical protein